jgi:hypothetical protein
MMDDVDGGRRGLRARAGPQLLAALREHYRLDGDTGADLGGSSSLNLLVTADGRRYVARVHRPPARRHANGVATELRVALGMLADLGAWRDAFASTAQHGRRWPDAPP